MGTFCVLNVTVFNSTILSHYMDLNSVAYHIGILLIQVQVDYDEPIEISSASLDFLSIVTRFCILINHFPNGVFTP